MLPCPLQDLCTCCLHLGFSSIHSPLGKPSLMSQGNHDPLLQTSPTPSISFWWPFRRPLWQSCESPWSPQSELLHKGKICLSSPVLCPELISGAYDVINTQIFQRLCGGGRISVIYCNSKIDSLIRRQTDPSDRKRKRRQEKVPGVGRQFSLTHGPINHIKVISRADDR